jgi:small subunit ribosomal protein S9
MVVTKKTLKNDKDIIKEETSEKSRYFYAVGKRKTSIAQVKVYPSDKNLSEITINGRKLEEYFTISRLRDMIKAVPVMAGQDKKFYVSIKVVGGGINSQAEAIRLGISRAMVKFDGELKKSFRNLGFLTRDARKVERKKPGLKKARRAPQWAKR